MKLPLPLLSAVALVAATCPVRADEIVDNLDTAKSAYEAGNYSESIQALDYASQLIRQKKGEAVAKLLPAAPGGWTSEEAESESQGNAMFGGGMVSAKRTYRKGDASVKIEIQSDSPLLQSLGMMFSNPMLMSASGAKIETIKGQKCAITFKNGATSGEVKTIVDNRYLVSIEGSDVKREDLVTFAKAIDFAKLTGLK
jgi:hypothetical protein